MKTFYLVRHAQYSNPRKILVGRLPVPLSNEGVKEAEKLADFFASKNISNIYSSPVERCKQTSEIIANNNIPLEFDVRIAETLSAYQGYLSENMDWSEFYQHHDTLGGESPQDIQKRMIDFWEEVKNKTKNDIIICSHGDPLYLLYTYLTHLPTPDITEIYNIPDGEYQPKASIRPVIYKQKKVMVSPLVEMKTGTGKTYAYLHTS